jgi:MFS family permease
LKSTKRALRFIIVLGVVSLFADFTYEGSRSIAGPYLGLLGASAVLISIVAGFGELLGYGLRLVSGPLAQRTGRFWLITIAGYVLQMSSVPLLALATNWQTAAVLIVLERVGKAVRNPPRDVMISYAAKEVGYGYGFGVHEALDQLGALIGPLLVALVLATHHAFRAAFVVLAAPAVVTIVAVIAARVIYPRPHDFERPERTPVARARRDPALILYLSGAILVAAGFADYPLIAFHFQRHLGMTTWLPIAYAIAMATSGLGSLLFGRLFDRTGLTILVPLTILSAISAPLVFLGGFWPAIVGAALWGIGMGVHESIIPAAVARMVHPENRATAYGVFTGLYGVAWFLGSIAIGVLYSRSLPLLVAFCVLVQLAAIPFFIVVARIIDRRSRGEDRNGGGRISSVGDGAPPKPPHRG